MPTDTAPTRGAALALDGHPAADLADLIACLRQWIDAEHDQLDPLLAKHDYDIIGLRIALDRYTALLRTDDQPPF